MAALFFFWLKVLDFLLEVSESGLRYKYQVVF